MAKTRTTRNGGLGRDRRAYWKQPWVRRVLQGNYSPFEKLLFMRAVSFGADGCWMKNETFMLEFGRSERPVQKAIAALWLGKELWITGWDSHKRCIYAANNPEVVAMAEARYKADRSAGIVADKTEFYIKSKTRGYKTQQKATDNGVKNDGVGRQK